MAIVEAQLARTVRIASEAIPYVADPIPCAFARKTPGGVGAVRIRGTVVRAHGAFVNVRAS